MALSSSKRFVICDVTRIKFNKEVLLLTPNEAYTEITLLIICSSATSLFVFKNLFLRRDLFMISLFISLFMRGAWSYYFFMGICLWIASWGAALNWWNSRWLFSEVIWIILNTVFNVKHKHLIRKVPIIPICHNICFLLFIEHIHYCQRQFMKI